MRFGAKVVLGLVALVGMCAACSTSEATATTLGPDGLGRIKLGMSEAEARATGLVRTDPAGSPECPNYGWTTASGDLGGVHFASADNGEGYVQAVFGGAEVSTPEGIHVGSTAAQAQAAYGVGYTRDYPDQAVAPVLGYDGEFYSFFFSGDTVSQVSVQQGEELLSCA